jgi:hypothetical protein
MFMNGHERSWRVWSASPVLIADLVDDEPNGLCLLCRGHRVEPRPLFGRLGGFDQIAPSGLLGTGHFCSRIIVFANVGKQPIRKLPRFLWFS